MKQLILTLSAIALLVTGCSRTHHYDDRLTAADSLLSAYPDEALSLLQSLNLNDPNEWDHAYQALLLTQVGYRCHAQFTSDSTINQALAYFGSHNTDHEKFTRSLIYKGAVMEELGSPDSAMLYYKRAAEAAAKDDCFNQGYVRMRMGALYRDNYAMDGRQISKYEEALEYLRQTDNLHYQLVCMINLGSLYCLKFPDKADSILNLALPLARELNDTVNEVIVIQNLMKNWIGQHKYEEAHQLARQVLSMNTRQIKPAFFIYAAHAYAKLHMPDSAELLLSVINNVPLTNAIDSIALVECRAEIALAHNDLEHYRLLMDSSRHRQDSLLTKSPTLSLMQVEDSFDTDMTQKAMVTHHRTTLWLWFLLALAVLTCCAAIWAIQRRKEHTIRMLSSQVRQEYESQLSELDTLQENLKQLNINDKRIKEFVSAHLSLMRDMIEGCYHEAEDKQRYKIMEVIKFQKINKDKWEKLYDYIDMEHNHIISRTKADYPQINDKDMLLIALTKLNFSCIQIAMILGYHNPSSLGIIKQRLAKKMDLPGTLGDYIEQF